MLETEEHRKLAENGAYDLIIYDQCAPQQRMPRANTLFIGTIPPTWSAAIKEQATNPATIEEGNDAGQVSNDSEVSDETTEPQISRVNNPQIIDHAKEHPLMAYIELGDIYVSTSNILPPTVGGRVLIESTDGPLLAIAPREGFEDAVLGFEVTKTVDGSEYPNTNWYRRYSFPTFLLNTLRYFVRQSQEGIDRTNLPGHSIALRTKSLADELMMKGPNSLQETVRRNTDGTYLFHDTDAPGYYEILDDGEVISRFTVNLFDGQESDVRIVTGADDDPNDNIEPAAAVRIGHVEVQGSAARPARKDLWRPLLLLAVAVLLFEWYIYNRRVYL